MLWQYLIWTSGEGLLEEVSYGISRNLSNKEEGKQSSEQRVQHVQRLKVGDSCLRALEKKFLRAICTQGEERDKAEDADLGRMVEGLVMEFGLYPECLGKSLNVFK